jgi:nitrite reductase (NADH) small subunit
MPDAAMGSGTRIAHISEIPEGEGRTIEVAGLQLAVFHTRDGVFATQPDCPHKQGPLADGLTGTGTVMCPLHDWTFDLRTGAGLGSQCRIATYPVTLGEDGIIRLAVSPAELVQA